MSLSRIHEERTNKYTQYKKKKSVRKSLRPTRRFLNWFLDVKVRRIKNHQALHLKKMNWYFDTDRFQCEYETSSARAWSLKKGIFEEYTKVLLPKNHTQIEYSTTTMYKANRLPCRWSGEAVVSYPVEKVYEWSLALYIGLSSWQAD